MVKKDLTFIDLGNDSKVEGLVNFEKLRMVAKEIRHICSMCSAKYVSCTFYLFHFYTLIKHFFLLFNKYEMLIYWLTVGSVSSLVFGSL